MRAHIRFSAAIWLSVVAAAVLPSCQHTGEHHEGSSYSRTSRWDKELGPVPVANKVTPVQMLRETGLQQSFIPPGTAGRYLYRPMRPTYITIHATENPTAGAWQHALALRRGALRAHKRPGGNRIGFLTWHFTVEQSLAVQHLPTTEQGEHADFDGPGNNFSIGIEMCENHGNSIPRTMDNTARLAACLMYANNIPLDHVVPHYHWARIGVSPEHKDCPHFLMDDARPGRTWKWFLNRVRAQYSRLTPGPVPKI